jgi:subfamily B ATP-binding cassette protein MsbA
VLDRDREPGRGGRALQRAAAQVIPCRRVLVSGTAEPTLQNVSVAVGPGQTLAIVGKSGGGKSTLVGLVPRLYDVTSGAVLLDGVDVRDYDLRDLRRQIAYVGQDVMLFNDSIRNNIAFGMESVPDSELEAAARAARDGVARTCRRPRHHGRRPGSCSRAASASASRSRCALEPPILVLDEATSALDTASERHIQAALEQLVKNRTTFVIAHRLSTIENADRILVMQEGAIAESGTHAELLARGGLYAQLHRLQFDAERDLRGWFERAWYSARTHGCCDPSRGSMQWCWPCAAPVMAWACCVPGIQAYRSSWLAISRSVALARRH